MSTPHSPTPWRAEPQDRTENWWLFDAENRLVGMLCCTNPAFVVPTDENRAQLRANVELVLNAVNGPPLGELLAAVGRYRDSLRRGMGVSGQPGGFATPGFQAAADQTSAAWQELLALADRLKPEAP